MKLKALSIRDSKAEYFNTPFFSKTIGEGERNFAELVNDEKSTVNRYPEDFDLYLVGEFDDQTGKFDKMETPQHLVKSVQLLKKPSLAQV